jgi:hypothetical protein
MAIPADQREALRILRLAQQGERDPRKLRIAAMIGATVADKSEKRPPALSVRRGTETVPARNPDGSTFGKQREKRMSTFVEHAKRSSRNALRQGTFAFSRHLRSSRHVHWPRSLTGLVRTMPP